MNTVGPTRPTSSGLATVIEEPIVDPAVKASHSSGMFQNFGRNFGFFDGDKFPGGFGATKLWKLDYRELRARSIQLYHENIHARGLLRRLVTNEIGPGLAPEATPSESVLGLSSEALDEWVETIETRFGLWAKSPRVCDWKHVDTFGSLQRKIRMEALVTGDVLVVLRYSQRTGLPQVQIISGGLVQTPFFNGQDGVKQANKIRHGVELDSNNRVVGYHVKQENGTFQRLSAVGDRSGRRIAWLVFGTDKLLDDVRGMPILGVVLQNFKELDRYRDAALRKAVVNSIIALFIRKTVDKPGTLPGQGGAVRAGTGTTTNDDGTEREFNITKFHPGLMLEELQVGEEPVAMTSSGTDEKYGDFEAAILRAIAWGNELPPEILQLSFSSNYSASQAANNEFVQYLNKIWSSFGEELCTPIYTEWMVGEALRRRVVVEGPSLTEARLQRELQYDVLAAWTSVQWYGAVKPSVDPLKQIKAVERQVAIGMTTYTRAARMITGTNYRQNVRRIEKEAEALVKARRPVLELEAEFGVQGGSDGNIEAIAEEVLETFMGGVEDAEITTS